MTFLNALKEIDLDHYARTHSSPEPDFLRRIDWRASQELVFPRMVSGHLQGLFLTMIVRMIRPKNILEIGTFAGYATVALARGLDPGRRITTIEIDPDLEPFIRKSLEEAGMVERTEVLFGDATQVLKSDALDLSETDLVYIDANKRHYTDYYEPLMERLRPGAFVIADNVLWDGKVADPEARDLQTQGIRAFNDLVHQDPRVEEIILPIRDGLSLIYIKE